MVKTVNVITSLCGAGLEREAHILRNFLATTGITTRFIHYTGGPNEIMERADLNISLEVICPQALYLSEHNWYAPNCEWYPSIYDQYLPRMEKILCKTMDCYRIWSKKVGEDKCVFTSFEARDLYDASYPRENHFLHIAGKSGFKGTEAVIAAWQKNPAALPPITIVAQNPEYGAMIAKAPEGITYHHRVSENELVRLMNTCRFHVQPSKYEGFGHILWEGMGCAANVFTADAPPMNEYKGAFPVFNPSYIRKQNLAYLADVDAQTIFDTFCIIDFESHAKFNELGEKARQSFLENNAYFRATLGRMIDGIN